jgi:hypothetical protein
MVYDLRPLVWKRKKNALKPNSPVFARSQTQYIFSEWYHRANPLPPTHLPNFPSTAIYSKNSAARAPRPIPNADCPLSIGEALVLCSAGLEAEEVVALAAPPAVPVGATPPTPPAPDEAAAPGAPDAAAPDPGAWPGERFSAAEAARPLKASTVLLPVVALQFVSMCV